MASIETVTIEAATIRLTNVQLRADLILDEAHLEGGDVRLILPVGEEPLRVTTGETKVRAVMSEANLNRFLEANLPPGAPVRNLRVEMFTGKAHFKGQFVKSVMSLPFTLDATPRIENGVRLFLDCQGTNIAGVGLPHTAVDIVEKLLNERLSFDLSESEIPVWLDEIRCEPGRLTVLGRAKIAWPPPMP